MQSSIKLGDWEVSLITGKPPVSMLLPRQTHGDIITQAALCVTSITEADGIIGTPHDAPFGVHTADCLPLVVTTDTRAAAIHISRHTLVAGILNNLNKVLDEEELRAAYIGPHICETCFTFKEKGEGIIEFEKLFPYAVHEQNSITHVSLVAVAQKYLAEKNVDTTKISYDTRCTFETLDLPSYRRWRAEGGTGDFPRMVTAVYAKTA